MKYEIQHRYKSHRWGPWEPGDIVELTDEVAAHLILDSPGVLAPVTVTVKKRQQKPRQNRQKQPAATREVSDG